MPRLGGARFRAMTGASTFVGGEQFLQFKLPTCGAGRINKVRVEYDAMMDLYSVTLYRITRRGMNVSTVGAAEHLDVEAMRAYIGGQTGLALSL